MQRGARWRAGRHLMVWLALAACLALAGLPTELRAQPGRNRSRNHQSVLQAFRPLVQEALKSTVQVLIDDKVVALGTVVDKDGWIATKYSEIDGRTDAEHGLVCEFSDGKHLEAQLFSFNEDEDLALLRVHGDGLVPIRWAESPPTVGSWLASAGKTEDPISIGVVSVSERKLPPVRFRFNRALLGVRLHEEAAPARVVAITPNSAAAKAQLQVDDVVRRVNDQEIRDRVQLVELIGKLKPGDKIELTVERGEETLKLSATLGSNPLPRFMQQNQLGGRLSERRDGFSRVVQHDSILTPEQCGGPIVNTAGEAIGINIARVGRVESYALPVGVLKPLIAKLQATQLVKADPPAGAGETAPTATPKEATASADSPEPSQDQPSNGQPPKEGPSKDESQQGQAKPAADAAAEPSAPEEKSGKSNE